MEHVYKQMHSRRLVFGVNDNKGDNSEHYKMMRNKHKLRDVVYQKPKKRILMKITPRLNQAIQAIFEDKSVQNYS